MVTELAIEVKPRDEKGRHLVIARHGPVTHKHRFDVDSQFHRRQFREAVVSKFGLEDDAHEWLETKILAAAETADSTEACALPNVISMADVKAKPVTWFWEPYIPAGAVSDLSGDPNEGKSTIAIDLIARYSRGDSMPPHTAPDGTYTIGSSLLIQGEDDPERTTKPRLVAAGACVERVHLLRTVTICDEPRFVQLPMDLPLIEKVIAERRIGLVAIDVLSAFTEPGTSLNDDAAMRRLFNPLASVAERTQAVFLILRHLNKREGTRAMYRACGSIAISGAARAQFAVAPNPDDPSERVFVPVKYNLGPRPHSLTYTIEAHEGSSRIIWGGQTELTAADVLKGQSESSGSSKTGTARAIIADILGRGPRGENEVKAACEQAGLSTSTYWRARKALNIQSERAGFGGKGQWLLSLPSTNGAGQEEF